MTRKDAETLTGILSMQFSSRIDLEDLCSDLNEAFPRFSWFIDDCPEGESIPVSMEIVK